MDCEACTDRLVDLLYDELDDADAESTRAHLAECEGCAAAFERMSAGRELASFMIVEEPPPAIRSLVLAAARERAQGRVSAKPEPVEPVRAAAREADDRDRHDEGDGLWSRFMRWLGGLAMGPQVAMAMMLLLMVGIGLWYLPELRRHDPADVHAIIDPAAGDEVGPSQGLEPAAPLDLEADPRTGRIRPREEEQARPQRAARAHPVAPSETSSPEQVEQPAADREAVAAAEPSERAPRSPRARQAEALDVDESASLAQMDLAPGQALGAERRESAPAVAPQPTTAPAYAMTERPAPATTEGAAPPPSAPRIQQAQAPAATSDALYQRGMQRMQQRDYRGAADDFETVVQRPDTDARRLLPSALHHLAQSESAAGSCPAAIRSYEQLLARYPSYSDANVVRIELADCYRRTGQISRARALLEDASRDARVASRAQRELVRLEAAERAMNRSTAETARTPDRAAAPAPSADVMAPASQ